MPTTTASLSFQPRNFEQKLYQACLDSCIRDLQGFSITTHLGVEGESPSAHFCASLAEAFMPVFSATRHTNNNNNNDNDDNQPQPLDTPFTTTTTRTASSTKSPPLLAKSAVSQHAITITLPEAAFPSPPPTPRKQVPDHSAPLLTPVTTMNRSALHGGPPLGPTPRGPSSTSSPRPMLGSQTLVRNSPAYKSLDALPSFRVPLDYDSPPGYASQDARSGGNFAIQPAVTSGRINLKKAAVKVLRYSVPSVNALNAVPTPFQPPPPVIAKPSAEDGEEASKLPVAAARFSPSERSASLDSLKARLDQKATIPKPVPPKAELESKDEAEFALDMMFARLMTGGRSPSPSEKSVDRGLPSRRIGILVDAVPVAAEIKPEAKVEPSIHITPVQKDEAKKEVEVEPSQTEQLKAMPIGGNNHWEDMSKEDLEREYLTKASEYLVSLPTSDSTPSAHLIKEVIIKLRHSFCTFTLHPAVSLEALQSNYIGAIVTYINCLPGHGTKTIDAKLVEQTLKENNGNFLRLCATLIDMQLIALENLDEVVGICRAVSAVVPVSATQKVASQSLESGMPQSRSAKEDAPKEDVKTLLPGPAGMNVPEASSIGNQSSLKPKSLPKPISIDPTDKITAWPSQEKRENPTGCRTVLLSGVSWAKTIHELQGCVWGGKLESIALPQPGSNVAMVKFMTVEGCQKFFDATANGIKVPGSKALITVDKHEGPNSVNDLLKSCSEGDASRCVRVVDADSDWGNTALRKIAIGTSKIKREIDIIKRGKTAQGRFYIEFRFANVYNALNFIRALRADEDWEPCLINYAKDPCETAQGVHLVDDEENSAGFS